MRDIYVQKNINKLTNYYAKSNEKRIRLSAVYTQYRNYVPVKVV